MEAEAERLQRSLQRLKVGDGRKPGRRGPRRSGEAQTERGPRKSDDFWSVPTRGHAPPPDPRTYLPDIAAFQHKRMMATNRRTFARDRGGIGC
eukprot:3363930-Prymnesium_polylepis.1